MWFIGVEVAQETSAPPPKKHPGSAPVLLSLLNSLKLLLVIFHFNKEVVIVSELPKTKS